MPQDTIVSIILAGGRGTRMRSDATHKVCFEVAGVPVILRALQTYEECGIDHHIIVIGELGEQVVETVGGRFPNVSFAYQPEPLGTGNAAKCGARSLEATGYDGRVLVVAGDRLLSHGAVTSLIDHALQTHSDCAFLVGHKADSPTSGRVVYDGGQQVAGIVETSEIALSNVVSALSEEVRGDGERLACGPLLEKIHAHFPSRDKAATACGELYVTLAGQEQVQGAEVKRLLQPLADVSTLQLPMGSGMTTLPAGDVEEMTEDVNLSSYLFRAPALYESLRSLSRDNAQGEEFLTDCVRALAGERDETGERRYTVTTVKIDDPDEAMAYNTPEELAAIERRMRAEQGGTVKLVERPRFLHERSLRPLAEWHLLFSTNPPEVQQFMRETYGPYAAVHEEKRRQYQDAISCYMQHYSAQDEVFLVRSPGRINLLGRHVDHRGGTVNVVAIDDEIILVASPRDDDVIELRNSDRSFSPASFSIQEQIARLDWGDWMTCVNSPKTLAMVSNGHWENYVMAAALRLQERFRDTGLRGLNLLTHGTIPMGSGLSSSSAMVIAAAEALVTRNRLPVRANLLVDLCGEGEWFVGTRGGNSDHAAIKFGRRGQVAHIGFFPFAVHEFLPFFSDHCLVVCNSGVEAKKSEGARMTFNGKILGYVAGELIFKQLFPAFAGSIHHLRDISCRNLGIQLPELYEMLRRLPMKLTRTELFERYGPFDPSGREKLRNLLSGLPEDDTPFDVRGVMLYGLAECERSLRCVEHLRRGDASGFGELWHVSHDGDRVVEYDEQLRPQPWDYEVDDEYLDGLIADIESGDPPRVRRAQLHRQPGKYGCSTPETDLIVDLARRVPGVKGAQLAGAGLGGCVMILVEEASLDELLNALEQRSLQAKRYHLPEGAGLVVV
ncbi:MAG: NTP transferase domain-containing protein [Armatimonadota bacterium]|nr:NTP transferase domain-containing protein [Armatimonadota bacterium]